MRIVSFAALLAGGLALAGLNGAPLVADEKVGSDVNPGFNPETGQINPGVPWPQPPSISEQRPVPSGRG
jgi:hypothetical protein